MVHSNNLIVDSNNNILTTVIENIVSLVHAEPAPEPDEGAPPEVPGEAAVLPLFEGNRGDSGVGSEVLEEGIHQGD